VGVKVAAPILFDIFNVLPAYKHWFDKPYDDMIQVRTCKKSGYLATEACDEIDSIWVSKTANRSPACPYHRIVHLDKTGQYQVTSDCERQANMEHVKWFVLPPAMEWYYQKRNADYKPLPPFRADCASSLSSHRSMEMIYPQNNTKLFIPIELDGKPGSVIFNLAHRKPNAKVFWHIDDTYIGETQHEHKLALRPSVGKHVLTVMDESGERVRLDFEVLK
jgi:penicillin-binding protein 1C